MRSGKSPNDLLRDIVINSINSQSISPTLIETDQAVLDPLNWDVLFDKITELSKQKPTSSLDNQASSDPTLTRNEIYADRMHSRPIRLITQLKTRVPERLSNLQE